MGNKKGFIIQQSGVPNTETIELLYDDRLQYDVPIAFCEDGFKVGSQRQFTLPIGFYKSPGSYTIKSASLTVTEGILCGKSASSDSGFFPEAENIALHTTDFGGCLFLYLTFDVPNYSGDYPEDGKGHVWLATVRGRVSIEVYFRDGTGDN